MGLAMMTTRFKTSTLFAASIVLVSTSSDADTTKSITQAVKESKTNINLRYRYESVDQDGVTEDAAASTLRTRLSWQSGKVDNITVKLEVDDVTRIGDDDYNSTANNKTQYPVVADPEGTDINQAFINYSDDAFNITAGRQRIVHNDQRFVGGVAWRQNEQTFDGYRIKYKANNMLNFDYSYVFNVNRIFGPKGGNADLKGDIHLFNSSYKIDKDHQLAFFLYALDFDTLLGASSNSYGVRYTGKLSQFNLVGSYAMQQDSGDNPNDFSADYFNLEVNTKLDLFTVGAGYEVLGSDNGIGFSTPLATLHKFQGFADKFLGTPGAGVQDFYVKAGIKVNAWAFKGVWHNFESDAGSTDLGSEFDLVASYKFNPHFSALFKYSSYDADTHQSNTDKLWFMVIAKF